MSVVFGRDKRVRVTFLGDDYWIFVREDGIAASVYRLDHGEHGTKERDVWRRGTIPSRVVASVLESGGFTTTGAPLRG